MLRASLALWGVRANLLGKGTTGESVQQVMDRMRKVRNQTFPATVIRSGLMNKTVTVSVTRMEFPHKKYRKHHAKVKAYGTLLVHDEDNLCRAGDKVLVQQSKPWSRHKHHRIHSIVEKERGRDFLEKNPEYAISRSDIKKMEERQFGVEWVTPA
mmetsp:Transcript_9219/g.13966  ORF Transcript_9219/g.13966 Transcript_9219/m.13966 type:complete len:155 (-) Transcript_9219:49-513(-)